MHSNDRNLASYPYVSAQLECPFANCSSLPLCYDYRLNGGVQFSSIYNTTHPGRLYIDSFTHLLDSSDGACALNYQSLAELNVGLPQQPTPSENISTLAFIGEEPDCTAANAIAGSDEDNFYLEYVKGLASSLKNTLLTCDLSLWEISAIEHKGETVDACRNLGNLPATDLFGEEYGDVELRVWTPPAEGGWTPGWEQGWCDKTAAEAGKCNQNLPVPLDNTQESGFKADGSLYVDFSEGIAGEFGAAQITGSHPFAVPSRINGWAWQNEVAVVEDEEALEEGNVVRLDSYVMNVGTAAVPRWEPGPMGSLVTTRYFASGSYEIRAKVPKASGFMWAYWVYQGGANVWSDRKTPEECGVWNDAEIEAGQEYSCRTCEDTYPSGKSPMWIPEDAPPGSYIPIQGRQILASEVDVEIPASAPQTSCAIEGFAYGHYAYKYHTMNINNNRWANKNGHGTFSNMWLAADRELIGDGKYHNYRFDWHTGGPGEPMRVDHFIDGQYVGTNDLVTPAVAARLYIALRSHPMSSYNGNGQWNGNIGLWRDPTTGTIHNNRDAWGNRLPEVNHNETALYASTYISRVSITPFYEEGDVYMPNALDQPFMNQRVVCGRTTELTCGTNPIAPYRTPNYFFVNEKGNMTAPCCGAICMYDGAVDANEHGHLTTTDPEGACPSAHNTVPYAMGERAEIGGCECQKEGPDGHGDMLMANSEYDNTCLFLPDKRPASTREAVYEITEECNPEAPFDYYGGDPWSENLNCRYDVDKVCIPPYIQHGEEDAYCMSWVEEHCGEGQHGAEWRVRPVEGNSRCNITVVGPMSAPEGYTYTALTRADLEEIKQEKGEPAFGTCLIDYVEQPVIAEDEVDCAWFVEDFCNGLSIDYFDTRISGVNDTNGHYVCAYRPLEQVPREPAEGEYTGYAATCDWDFTYYRPTCEKHSDCEEWTEAHCDRPGDLAAHCSGAACQIYVPYRSPLQLGMKPVPLCYNNYNNTPPSTRNTCNIDYLKYPPCGGTTYADAMKGCKQWVNEHCDDETELYYVEPAPEPDRFGNYACHIQSQYEKEAGGDYHSCTDQLCLGFATPEPTVSPTPSPTPSPSISATPSISASPSQGYVPPSVTPSPSFSASPAPCVFPGGGHRLYIDSSYVSTATQAQLTSVVETTFKDLADGAMPEGDYNFNLALTVSSYRVTIEAPCDSSAAITWLHEALDDNEWSMALRQHMKTRLEESSNEAMLISTFTSTLEELRCCDCSDHVATLAVTADVDHSALNNLVTMTETDYDSLHAALDDGISRFINLTCPDGGVTATVSRIPSYGNDGTTTMFFQFQGREAGIAPIKKIQSLLEGSSAWINGMLGEITGETGSSENPVIDVTDTLYHRPCGAWNETDASVDETSGNCTALIDVEASTPDTLTQIEDFIEYYSTHGFMSQVPLRHVSVYRFPGPGEMQHNSTNLVAFVDAPSTSANELEVATSMLSMLASSGAVDGLLQRSGYGTADIATAVVCEHCDKQAMYAVTGALEAFLMFSSSLDIDEALQTAIYSAIESFVDQFISAEYITGIEVTVTVKLAGSSGAERRMLATDKEYTVAIEVKTEGAGLVGLRRMQLGIQEDWDPKIADELRKALEEAYPNEEFGSFLVSSVSSSRNVDSSTDGGSDGSSDGSSDGTNPNSRTDGVDDDADLSGGAIAGIAIGAVAVVAVIAVVVIRAKKKKRAESDNGAAAGTQEAPEQTSAV